MAVQHLREGVTITVTPQWHWLSVVDHNDKFVGAAVVEVLPLFSGVAVAQASGLFPDGSVHEVLMLPIPEEMLYKLPDEFRNRLLTEEECVERLEGKRLGELRKQSQ